MADVDVKAVIKELFAVAGVQRVVSIDDMNGIAAPVEDALTLAQELTPEDVAEIFNAYPTVTAVADLEIRLSEIRKLWEKEGDDKRRYLLNRLRVRKSETDTVNSENSTEVVDENTFLELPPLFSEYNLELMSLKQWREKRQEIISEAMPPTLLLVDEDFRKEEGGTRDAGLSIIREVMTAAPADKILCALLTHNPRYQSATLHEVWKALCQREGLSQSKFVLIPKKLIKDNVIGFAWLVKLALLNGRVDGLKTIARNILQAAEENARRRLNDIDIYDFDQIVFRSSRREGVWEPDTLFRVFGLFHHDETRKLAKQNADLYKLADDLRAISTISTEGFASPSYNTMALQRLELYEDADYLNAHFIPIDSGDIFQKTGDSTKRFILLSQACDLMVRSDGKRSNPFFTEALLAEIVTMDGPIKDRDAHAELPFLDEKSTEKNFVSFKRAYAVKMSVLDMCALNSGGEASFEVDASCPDRVIPAWKLHYARIAEELGKTINRTKELTKSGLPPKVAVPLIARCANSLLFKPTIEEAKRKISFNLKRIGRLRQPRAAALLSRYAAFMARQAFDHDLGDYEYQETEKSRPGAAEESTNGRQQVAVNLPIKSEPSPAAAPEVQKGSVLEQRKP